MFSAASSTLRAPNTQEATDGDTHPLAGKLEWRRVWLTLALGTFAFMLLPLVTKFSSSVSGPLVARALVASCVVGLLGAPLSKRLAVPIIAVACTVCGSSILFVLVRHTINLSGLAASLLVAPLVSLAIAALASGRRRRIGEIFALCVVLIVALVFAGVLPGAMRGSAQRARDARLAVSPQPEAYHFDGADFIRTYQLMKQGTGYYEAFRQAVLGDSRHDNNYLQSPFNYREPLAFEMWRALPGSDARDLLKWFIVLSVLTGLAAYILASKLVEPGAAILAPIALVSFYFFFWWTKTWFTMIEIWSAGFVVAAVAALIRRKTILGLVFLVAAVATRELTVVLVPAWIIAWWLGANGPRRTSWWVPVAATMGPAAVLIAHILSVPPLSPGGAGIANWLHGGPDRLIDALKFGWALALWGTRLSLLIVPLALASALLAKPQWRRAGLLAAVVLPSAFLLCISGGVWEYQWGTFFTPLAVAVAAGALGRLLPSWDDGLDGATTEGSVARPVASPDQGNEVIASI